MKFFSRTSAIISTFAFAIYSTSFLEISAVKAQSTEKKLGFADMNDEQQKRLWDEIDNVAPMEAFAKACDIESNIEARIVEAARPCVKQEALARIKHYWHEKVRKESDFKYDAKYNKERFCNLPYTIQSFKKYMNVVNAYVSDVSNSCTICRLTGMCR